MAGKNDQAMAIYDRLEKKLGTTYSKPTERNTSLYVLVEVS